MEPDFSGYATKADIRCSDGRTIKPEAFRHMDGKKVPLLWQHGHSDVKNVLGHAILHAVADGIRADGFLNSTPGGVTAKQMLIHGDIDSMSIFANQLVERTKVVHHGMIKEVSLVLSGANPGAKIEHVRLQHGDDPDDFVELDEEAIISRMGGELTVFTHSDDESEEETDEVEETEEVEAKDEKGEGTEEQVAHADAEDETIQDIIDGMSEKERNVLNYMVGAALENAASAEHSDDTEGLAHQEGNNDMTHRNVFDQNGGANTVEKPVLSHDDMKEIFRQGIKLGSLREAVEQYADAHLQHGVNDVDLLFPDAQSALASPELNKRRTEWVASVLDGVRSTPFSRVKSLVIDLTADEARAKGYVKGSYKKEQWVGITKRTTSPTTVYKKQKLDRDDVLDIKDFDAIAFIKMELELMLKEEIARAILIGDGRDPSDEDKVKDPIGAQDGVGIRSILNDNELYVTTLNVPTTMDNYEVVVDAVLDGMEYYKGTGTPTFYTTIKNLNGFLKAKDNEGRRYYKTKQEVADALGVSNIVTVEPMNDVTDLVGIIVNMADYNVGTDRGGEINFFDDFDLNYNQMLFLNEGRSSGALVKIKSAMVIRKSAATFVVPTKPSFNKVTGVVTIPTITGVTYKNADTDATLSAGAQTALAAGASITIKAVPSSGSYVFADTVVDGPWTFTRDAA